MLESLEADDVSLLMIIEEYPGKTAAQLGRTLSRGAMSINASIFNLKDKNLIIENRDNTFKINEREINKMNVQISKESYTSPENRVLTVGSSAAPATEKEDDVGTTKDLQGSITEGMILQFLRETDTPQTATEISGHFGRKWGAVSAVLSKMVRNRKLIKYGIRYELPAQASTVEVPVDVRRPMTSASEIANMISIKTKDAEWLTQQQVFDQLSTSFIIERSQFFDVFDQMCDLGQLVAVDENDLVVSLDTEYGPDLRFHAVKNWSAKEASMLAGNYVKDRNEFTLKHFVTCTQISPDSAKLFLREFGFVFDGQIAFASENAPKADAPAEEPAAEEHVATEEVVEKHALVSVESLNPEDVRAYVEDYAPTEQEFASHFHLIEDAEVAVDILCKLNLIHLDSFSGQVRLYNGPAPKPITEEQVSELIRETCSSTDTDAQVGALTAIVDGLKGGRLAPALSDVRENETVIASANGDETRSYDLPGAHIEVESKVVESDGDFSELYAQLEQNEIAATSITLRGESAIALIKLHKFLGGLDAGDIERVVHGLMHNNVQAFNEKYGMPDCNADCVGLHFSEGIEDRCISKERATTVNPLWVHILEVLEERYERQPKTARTIREIIEHLEQR